MVQLNLSYEKICYVMKQVDYSGTMNNLYELCANQDGTTLRILPGILDENLLGFYAHSCWYS